MGTRHSLNGKTEYFVLRTEVPRPGGLATAIRGRKDGEASERFRVHSDGGASCARQGQLGRMHDFRRLHVWQRSREFAVAISKLTRGFPRSDHGVVAAQLRRAALSIPANIAEGCGKSSRKDVVRFLQIASASALEVENHLLIASDLGYLSAKAAQHSLGEIQAIQRMLAGLSRRVPG